MLALSSKFILRGSSTWLDLDSRGLLSGFIERSLFLVGREETPLPSGAAGAMTVALDVFTASSFANFRICSQRRHALVQWWAVSDCSLVSSQGSDVFGAKLTVCPRWPWNLNFHGACHLGSVSAPLRRGKQFVPQQLRNEKPPPVLFNPRPAVDCVFTKQSDGWAVTLPPPLSCIVALLYVLPASSRNVRRVCRWRPFRLTAANASH